MLHIPQFSIEIYLLIIKSFSLFCFLAAFLILFKTIIVTRLKKIAQKTANHIDDIVVEIIQKINWIFYIGLALFISLQLFHFTGVIKETIDIVFLIIVTYQVVRSGNVIIKKSTEHFIANHRKLHPEDDISMLVFLSKMGKFILWFIGLLLILSNLGYNITSLLAGLGIGGIAIALAVQSILSDIFSSFSIYLDKPFVVGDFIVVNDHSGTVKHIGVKTTRIKTLEGEELVVPNKLLIETNIQNYKKMQYRRVIFQLHINQEKTSYKKLELVPEMIVTIIETIPHVDVERAHFKKIYGNRLLFEVSYIVRSNEYTRYLDIQQEINFAIIALFKKHKITLYDALEFLD